MDTVMACSKYSKTGNSKVKCKCRFLAFKYVYYIIDMQ